MKWVRWFLGRKTSSWHVLVSTVNGVDLTRCGRWVPREAIVEYAATLHLEDKSCETCLRLEATDPS